jgi:hypothetical protein
MCERIDIALGRPSLFFRAATSWVVNLLHFTWISLLIPVLFPALDEGWLVGCHWFSPKLPE